MPLPRQRLSYSAIVDQFERLYQESATIIRIMAISLHPYITGVAHRIGHDRYVEASAGR